MSFERIRTIVWMTWSASYIEKNDSFQSNLLLMLLMKGIILGQKIWRKKKNRLWSNYIGRAACRCLFTSAIPRLLNMRSLTCSHFAPQPVQPSLVALVKEIPQHPPCRCQASCGRSINIEQRQAGLPPASHSHNPTPEVAPVTERRRAFQSMINHTNRLFLLKSFEMVQLHPCMINYGKLHIDIEGHLANASVEIARKNSPYRWLVSSSILYHANHRCIKVYQ